ncbi:MAG: CheB methylesterase domain-containing protein [bacterium]
MALSNIAIIGSSAGGPRILKEIFTELPVLNGSIIVIQHMPEFVNKSFTEELNSLTEMQVVIPDYGQELASGTVYIAPSEYHCELINNSKIRLYKGQKVNFVCPSIDVTMKSVVKRPYMNIIGIILTGMGSDGKEGIRHINSIYGTTIAQDKYSSIIFGMPREAIETGCVDYVLNPEQIKEKLIELMLY